MLDTYFKREEDYIGAIKDYPIKSLNASLSELLAGNEERLHESKTFGLNKELARPEKTSWVFICGTQK